jgi:benzoate 4-monooxygenase
MAIINLLLSPWAILVAIVVSIGSYVYAHFVTYSHLRHIPAPFPAQFTNLWLFRAARHGRRFQTIDQVHKELGKVVRIQPNHVSIADDAAIQEIYGHGNGFLKSYVALHLKTPGSADNT